MRKLRHFFLSVVLILLVLGQTMAQQLSVEQARTRAEAFLQQKTGLRSAGELQLSFAVSDTTQLDAGATLRVASGSDHALLYAFSREAGGFVIASGDERTHAVLAYGTEGSLDGNNLPDGTRGFLHQYAVEIATLRADGGATGSEEQSYDPAWPAVAPMITADWGQSDPYNRQTPTTQDGKHCLTGCPATMLAQLMDYYQYQNWKVAEETWFSGTGGQGEINRNVTVRFDSPVDWSLLKRNYRKEGFTEAEADEVAKLMKYTGAALHCIYGPLGSGVMAWDVLKHVARVADYGLKATSAQAWQYTLRSWSEKIYQQLAAGRPMPYASIAGGHIFLLDGYAGEGYFHFNWGWESVYNGNYLLSALLTNYNMLLHQVGIFDCCPSTMEPINQEPILVDHLSINTSGETPALELVLASMHSGVQTGQMFFALCAGNGKCAYTSPLIKFTFTPNENHRSGTIRLPFPEYAKLTESLYVLVPMQLMGKDWRQIPTKSTQHGQICLVRKDQGYEVMNYVVALKGSLVDPPTQIPIEEKTRLTLDVTNKSNEMATATFMALLYNEEKRASFNVGTVLCAKNRQTVDLTLQVSGLPEGKYKLIVYGSGVSTTPVEVELVRSTVLEITEAPEITTVETGKLQTATYTIKNTGSKPFSGTLNFILAVDDPYGKKAPVLHRQMVELAAGEVQKITWSYTLSDEQINEGTSTGRFLILQSDLWALNCEGEEEPYLQSVNIALQSTANEAIDASETTVSWQDRTLCVESAQPLKAYHIYKVNGEAVANGMLSGTSARIDGSAWPTGVYVVAIETEDGKTVIYKVRN